METLDRLLAEKNRRLQNENASLRVLNEGFKGTFESLLAIVLLHECRNAEPSGKPAHDYISVLLVIIFHCCSMLCRYSLLHLIVFHMFTSFSAQETKS